MQELLYPTVPTLLGPFTQIVTMAGLPRGGPLHDEQLAVLEEGGILCYQGRIMAIGPYQQLTAQATHRYLIHGPAVAFPGLIDAHTHLCWAGDRCGEYAKRLQGVTYEELAQHGGGILATVRATRKATSAELAAITVKRLRHLMQAGVTTCEVKSGYGLTVESELTILRAIASAAHRQPVRVIATCLAAHTLPPEYSDQAEYLTLLTEKLLPSIRLEQLARRVDIFVDDCAFSVKNAHTYLQAARQQGFELCIHADQFSCGGAALAAAVGALSADHLESSGLAEAKLLAAKGVVPVLLPGASLGLGVPFAPARLFLDAGLPLVLASDWNPGSAPMGQLLTAAALLGCQQRLTLAETWAALTYRAALALGCHDRGQLAVDYLADLAVFPCRDWRAVLYWQGALQPSYTFIGGVCVHQREE